MADISAAFGVLLITGIAFPGMLFTWWLLFPSVVERAQTRLEGSPWRCFWSGGVLLALVIFPVVILLSLPLGLAKFLGWALITVVLAVSSLGAAGIAARMGESLGRKSSVRPAAGFLQGALALELAVLFPVIGWFIVLPLTVVTALGASALALLRGKSIPAPAPVPAPAPTAAAVQE
jgi:hypothetical protein